MKTVKKFFDKYFVAFLIFLALFIIYYLTTEYKIADPFLFPKVSAISKAFKENAGLMFVNMFASFGLLIPSIIISLLLALLIGTILGLNKKIRDRLHPVIYAFSVIPSILMSPFALLLAPNFQMASIFLIVYNILWATLFATITGIMTIDKRYIDKARALHLTGIKKLLFVVLPAASPSILAGFINSLRSSFVMLVYAEMYGAHFGMGFFVKKYSEFGMYDYTWAGFLFMVVVLVVVMQLFERVKKRILYWTIDG